jgi:acyl carrier protein
MAEISSGGEEKLGAESLMPIVLEAWRRALRDPDLRTDDDFFAAGGDSLLADQVMLDIAASTGIEIPVATLFTSPTPTEFAEALAELARAQ